MGIRGLTLTALLLLALQAANSRDRSSTAFLFTYFTGNGEDGLHLATSGDGLHWTPLGAGRSYLTPKVGTKLMRDPCLVRGPDGQFHLVWTTGWWDQGVGVAHSPDLISWSTQQFVPVMAHEPTALNAWAPEILHDRTTGGFLIYWASTIPGHFKETEPGGDADDKRRLNHRLYSTTTTDFRTFAPTRLLYDGGFNVIDGTIVDLETRFGMVVKDETRWPTAKKHLRMAFAERPEGPWSAAGPAFTRDWVEGPTTLKVGDAWLVYFDEYTRKRYGAMRTRDFATWEDVSGSVRFPEGARHGTTIAVPRAIVERLDRTP
jgi:hypothetical protein